ncbi:hypothetical protein [Algoriphagus sp.]
MLEALLWNTYLSTLVISTIAYYLIIIGIYYPKELCNPVSEKSIHQI